MSVITGACFSGACHVCRYPEPPFTICDCPHHKEEDVAVVGEATVKIKADTTEFRRGMANLAEVYAEHLEMMAKSLLDTAANTRRMAAEIREGIGAVEDDEDPRPEVLPHMPHEFEEQDTDDLDEMYVCGVCNRTRMHPIHHEDERR